jgi:hypothetical protein
MTAQGLPSADGGTDYGWPNTNGHDVNFTKASQNCIKKFWTAAGAVNREVSADMFV